MRKIQQWTVAAVAVSACGLAHAQRSARPKQAELRLEEPSEHGGYFAFALAPKAKLLAGGTGIITLDVDGKQVRRAGGDVVLWNARTGRIRAVLSAHSKSVSWVRISRDAKRVVSISGADGTVCAWRVGSKRPKKTFRLGTPVAGNLPDPAMDASATTLVHVESKTVDPAGELQVPGRLTVWDVRKGKKRWSLDDSSARAIAISPDGSFLAVFVDEFEYRKRKGSWIGEPVRRALELYSLGDGERVWSVPLKRSIGRLLFSRQTLVTVALRGVLRRGPPRNYLSLQRRRTADGGAVGDAVRIEEKSLGTLGLDASGKRLAVVRSFGSSIGVWDTTNGNRVQAITFPKGKSLSRAVFASDLRTVIGCRDHVPVWMRL